MTLTYPAALAWDNAADTAVITASAAVIGAQAWRLQDPHIGRKWRAEADSVYLTVTLAADTEIDTIALFGLNLTTAGVTRVRVSLTDPSAQDGALYDSGAAAGRVSAYYGALVVLLDGVVTARYIRIDLSEAAVAYIEAGFLFVATRHQVGINFAYGASDTPVDPSIKTKSRSGATHIDARPKYRVWDFSFEWLSEAERFGWVEDIDRMCGASRNIMVVRSCASTDLGRDVLCGLITEGAPVISRDGFIASGNAYSKSYRVEQRL